MQLSVREVARLLKVSENTVYRWVDERSLPAQQINSQYFFNKAELLEWAALKKVDVAPEIFADAPAGNGATPTLSSVLERGGPALSAPAHDDLRRQAVVLSGAAGGASAVFSLDAEPPALRDRYGNHRFGKALLLARRLAEAGVPMITVYWPDRKEPVAGSRSCSRTRSRLPCSPGRLCTSSSPTRAIC